MTYINPNTAMGIFYIAGALVIIAFALVVLIGKKDNR